jgi:chorismate mutase/prephenate dehydratase
VQSGAVCIHAAAIAGSIAADRYDLEVLEADIQDNSINATRFLVLGRQCSPPTGRDRTSLMFSIPNKVGALHRALALIRRQKLVPAGITPCKYCPRIT